MYNEDEYLGEDAFTDISSEETTSSVDTQIKKKRKLIEYTKRLDNGYDRYRKMVNGEMILIESYSTQLLRNGFIRHAVDGIKCPHRAGSKYDDLYFVVTDTTSRTNETRKLYYYSPEDFERHHYLTVPQEIKEKWSIRNMRANKRFNL